MLQQRGDSKVEILFRGGRLYMVTLPETNSSLLKMDGWNTILSYWGGLFSGVSGRVQVDTV